jgi:hypothetical protein
VRPRVQQQEPRARVAADDRFDPLAIEPARRLDGSVVGQARDVSIDDAAQPVRHAGRDPGEARAARKQHNAGVRRPAQSFAARRVGRVACLRKILAGDYQHTRSCSGHEAGRSLRGFH